MIEGIPVATLTPSVLLGLAVLMLLTGRLVPRIYLTDKSDEADRWRLAYEAERTARALSDAQTVELLEVGKTTHSLVVAMAATSERIRGNSGGRDAPRQKEQERTRRLSEGS